MPTRHALAALYTPSDSCPFFRFLHHRRWPFQPFFVRLYLFAVLRASPRLTQRLPANHKQATPFFKRCLCDTTCALSDMHFASPTPYSPPYFSINFSLLRPLR